MRLDERGWKTSVHFTEYWELEQLSTLMIVLVAQKFPAFLNDRVTRTQPLHSLVNTKYKL